MIGSNRLKRSFILLLDKRTPSPNVDQTEVQSWRRPSLRNKTLNDNRSKWPTTTKTLISLCSSVPFNFRCSLFINQSWYIVGRHRLCNSDSFTDSRDETASSRLTIATPASTPSSVLVNHKEDDEVILRKDSSSASSKDERYLYRVA